MSKERATKVFHSNGKKGGGVPDHSRSGFVPLVRDPGSPARENVTRNIPPMLMILETATRLRFAYRMNCRSTSISTMCCIKVFLLCGQ